ncbi:hypothetical protein FRC02_001715 [Tulasnella sp. 418]|nr:hypothetical protein FRC02_001715 [Tulasnella sp. 418]
MPWMRYSVYHRNNLDFCSWRFVDDDDDDDDGADCSYEPGDHKPNYETALDISRVCSYWYNLALNQPRLWSYLDSDVGRGTIKLFLERSTNAPLFITCAYKEGKPSNTAQFMRLVLPHSHRWKAFTSYSEDTPRLFRHLLQGDFSTPILESFVIRSNPAREMSPPSWITERAPCLREFHMEWSPFLSTIRPEFLSGLTSLGLKSTFEDGRHFSIRNYEDLFTSCPRLQTVFITGELHCPPQPLSTFSVKVPNLRALYLYDLDPEVTTILLFSLFPNPAKLPLIKIAGSCDAALTNRTFTDKTRAGCLMDLACRNISGVTITDLEQSAGQIQVWRESEGQQSTLLQFVHLREVIEEALRSCFSPNGPPFFKRLTVSVRESNLSVGANEEGTLGVIERVLAERGIPFTYDE